MNRYVCTGFRIEVSSISATLLDASTSEMMDPKGIFPNNELDLRQIKVYGFDFGRDSLSVFHQLYSDVFRVTRRLHSRTV